MLRNLGPSSNIFKVVPRLCLRQFSFSRDWKKKRERERERETRHAKQHVKTDFVAPPHTWSKTAHGLCKHIWYWVELGTCSNVFYLSIFGWTLLLKLFHGLFQKTGPFVFECILFIINNLVQLEPVLNQCLRISSTNNWLFVPWSHEKGKKLLSATILFNIFTLFNHAHVMLQAKI